MGFFQEIKALRSKMGCKSEHAGKADVHLRHETSIARSGASSAREQLQAQRSRLENKNTDNPFSARRMFYYMLFALLFFALYLSYRLMQPFLNTIILACVFTMLCHPVYARILPRVRHSEYLASAMTILLIIVVVCLPLVFFISRLLPQASQSIRDISQWLIGAHLDDIIATHIDPVFNWLNDEITWIDLNEINLGDIRGTLTNVARDAGQKLFNWGTGAVNLVAHFFLMLVIMFFLLKDGEGMVFKLKALIPLREEQKDIIIRQISRMAEAVLIGGFAVALIQGFVGGIGLALVGIPALFWGTVMCFAALVPVLGTGLVWVPAVVYLVLTKQYAEAAFLTVWCGVLVTSIDSILRPIIMRGSSKISLLFLFMSVFGGMQAFGMHGLIYGPLILSFVGGMIGIYSAEYKESFKTYNRTVTGYETLLRRAPRYPKSTRRIHK